MKIRAASRAWLTARGRAIRFRRLFFPDNSIQRIPYAFPQGYSLPERVDHRSCRIEGAGAEKHDARQEAPATAARVHGKKGLGCCGDRGFAAAAGTSFGKRTEAGNTRGLGRLSPRGEGESRRASEL